jgi:pentatricopeptide repeat protein
MLRIAAIALSILVVGCAQPPLAQRELFSDHLFARPAEPIRAADVFALSADMKRYLETELGAASVSRPQHRRLYDALYAAGRLKLDYDAEATRNAAETFAARSGNCLSLVIMTAALAKGLGLEVHYQSAFVEPTWSRTGGIHFLSGHVNLALGGRTSGARIIYDARELLVIDFLPAEEMRALRVAPLAEETVVAMYMNNRAAEALARGELDPAYWWTRAAIEADSAFLAAYNTLAVVYLRHGDWDLAEQVLRRLLERDPGNAPALSNLAIALDKLGRAGESAALQRKLSRLEPYPPFHFLDRGLAAMRLGDSKAARELFAKEVERDPYYHEAHFWLGMAHLRLGEVAQGRKHIALALDNSKTRGERELYAAKLERLRAAGRP